MNENNAPIAILQEPEELELDLRDMLTALLLRWKTVLVWMLVAAVLGCGIALVRGGASGGKDQVGEEDLAGAREELAENKIADAERLFFQYVAYQELQRDLTEYYSEFISTQRGMDENSVVQMYRKYYVTSSVENLGDIVKNFALTEKEYNSLRKIYPDEEAGARIYDRVSISSWNSDRITVANLAEGDAAPVRYLFTLSLYGKTEEQCLEMMSVVDQAFLNRLDELKPLDPELETAYVGDDFNYDMLNYVTNLRKGYIDRITNADKEITDLTTRVSKLESDELKYYNLLKEQYEQSLTSAEEKISWKKWTVIGAFLGAVIGVVIVFWPYLFDGKVKTADELGSQFRTVVLSRVSVKGKKNLFGKWAASLTGTDGADPAVRADMLAADLGILLEKSGKKALYLLRSEDDAEAAALAEQVKARLQGKVPGVEIAVGNPGSSVAELEQLGASELGVVFGELKQTKRACLLQWAQICGRYRLPLAGAVSVQKCW